MTIFEVFDKDPRIKTAEILLNFSGIWLFFFLNNAKMIVLKEELSY